MAPVLFKYEDLFGRSAARPKSFKRVDVDGNQALSAEELQRAFGGGWQSVFKSLDLNADGRVTREEVQSSGSSSDEQNTARTEPKSGTRTDQAAGSAGHSQGAEPGRSSPGKGSRDGEAAERRDKASSSGGSGGQDKGSGKADQARGAAGKGGGNASGSGGNRGRN